MANYCIILVVCFATAFTYGHGSADDPSTSGSGLGAIEAGAALLALIYLTLLRSTASLPLSWRGQAIGWTTPWSPLVGSLALGFALFSLKPPRSFEAWTFLDLALLLTGLVVVTAALSWRSRRTLPYGAVVLCVTALALSWLLVLNAERISIVVSLLTLAELGCLSLLFVSLARRDESLPGPVLRFGLTWVAVVLTIVICVFALANNAVLICVATVCVAVFLDLPNSAAPQLADEDRLWSRVYWTAGLVFWLAVVAYTVAEPFDGRVIYALVGTSMMIPFGHWLMFGHHPADDIRSVVKPVLYVNMVVLVLHYIFSNEFVHLREDFHVGYHFGNFSDFMAIINSQVAGTYEWVLTGYEPFVYAFAKLFGGLSHWRPGAFVFTEHLQLYYLIFLVVGIAPLGLLFDRVMKARALDGEQSFFGVLFLVTSYPVLFEIERGNLILLSAAFLALVVWSFQRGALRSAAIFMGLLVSLKILNVIYVPFVLYNLWKKVHWFIATVVVATLSSLVYLVGFSVEKWLMFARVLLVPVGGMFGGIPAPLMTDSGKLAGGTTGVDAYRVLLRSLFLRLKDNITTDMGWFNLALLIGGAVLIVYFYRRVRQSADWIDELMLLTVVPLLAHPASGSYNLLLLIPLLLELAARPSSPHRDRILRFAMPIFLLSAGLVITTIACCGPGYYTPVTPESFLVPFALTMLCLEVCGRRPVRVEAT